MKTLGSNSRCMAIKESFQGNSFPESLKPYKSKEYSYVLNRSEPVIIGIFSVPRNIILGVAEDLSKRLLPKRFYAHFVFGKQILVIFPMCLIFVTRGNENSIQRAQQVGLLFDIPLEEMMFGQLFNKDHPGGR